MKAQNYFTCFLILISTCAALEKSPPSFYKINQNLEHHKYLRSVKSEQSIPSPSTEVPTTGGNTTSASTTTTPTTAKTTPTAPTTASTTTAAPTTVSSTTAAPTTVSTTTVAPTPPHCTPGDKKPITGSCRNYTECDKNYNWVEKTCTTWCHNFNPTLKKCDWNWKYECVDPTTEIPPCTKSKPTTVSSTTVAPSSTPATSASSTPATSASSTPATSASSTPATSASSTPATSASSTAAPTVTTSTTISPTTKGPECVNGKTKVYQKGDCKDYLECDSGKWTKKSCSFGFDFDINKLECRWSWWAKC